MARLQFHLTPHLIRCVYHPSCQHYGGAVRTYSESEMLRTRVSSVQNASSIPNLNALPSFNVFVICPKFGEVSSRPGSANCG